MIFLRNYRRKTILYSCLIAAGSFAYADADDHEEVSASLKRAPSTSLEVNTFEKSALPGYDSSGSSGSRGTKTTIDVPPTGPLSLNPELALKMQIAKNPFMAAVLGYPSYSRKTTLSRMKGYPVPRIQGQSPYDLLLTRDGCEEEKTVERARLVSEIARFQKARIHVGSTLKRIDSKILELTESPSYLGQSIRNCEKFRDIVKSHI